MSDEQIEKTYSDTIIIVDEAHNLRFQPKESKVSLYDQVYRLINKVPRIISCCEPTYAVRGNNGSVIYSSLKSYRN